jgi:hypothetical protein
MIALLKRGKTSNPEKECIFQYSETDFLIVSLDFKRIINLEAKAAPTKSGVR